MKRIIILAMLLTLLLCGCNKGEETKVSAEPSDEVTASAPVISNRPGLPDIPHQGEDSDIPIVQRPGVSAGPIITQPTDPDEEPTAVVDNIFNSLGYKPEQVIKEDYKSTVHLDYGEGVTAYIEVEQLPSNPQKISFVYQCAGGVKSSDYASIAEDTNKLFGTQLDADDIADVVNQTRSFAYGTDDEFVYLHARGNKFTSYILV